MSNSVKDMPLAFDILTYLVLVYSFYSYMSSFASGAIASVLSVGIQNGLLIAVFFQLAKIGSILNNKK